jgi:hypothetical protein
MPIESVNPNFIFGIGTSLIAPGLASPQNMITLVREHASDQNREALISSFKHIASGNNTKVNYDMVGYGGTANADNVYNTVQEYIQYNNLNYDLYVPIISNQAFPLQECWSTTSASILQVNSSGTISAAPKLATAGVLISGSTNSTYSLEFTTASKYYRLIEQKFTGTINIQAVLQITGNGYLIRDYLSTTNYILKFQQNGTDSPIGSCTLDYVKKNGVFVDVTTSGELYSLFSGGFNLLEAQISGVNIGAATPPSISMVGKLEELIVFQ